MLAEFLVLFVLVLVLWTIVINVRPNKHHPKGPFNWPLLGILPQLYYYNGGKYWYRLFTEYSKIYGKVFSIRLGLWQTVVINDVKLIKDAFNNPLLCGRPSTLALRERTGGELRGILFQDGDEWAEQRRFTLRHLRDFGFGKTSMENMILDEVNEMIERMKEDAGKPMLTHNRFNIAVLNALWTITSGSRLKQDDPELETIIAAITRNIASSFTNIITSFLPALAIAAPKLTGFDQFRKDLSYTYDYLMKFTKMRLESYDGSSQDNFSDIYIKEIKRTSDPASSFHGKRGELTMTAVLQDLFVAGAETTSTTLSWACLYLSIFPETQSKLHAEIDQVLGDTAPSLDHRLRMPYTEAFIMETLRYSSMVPLSLAHRAVEDVMLDGYFIQKDSIVFGNLHNVHHSKEIWGDPENFRPERFILEDGTCMPKHDAFMPFSFGKRLCLGEGLAKNELFLFITSIFKQFHVTWDENRPKPGLERISGAVMGPKPHYLVFSERV